MSSTMMSVDQPASTSRKTSESASATATTDPTVASILRRDNEEYHIVRHLPRRFPTDLNHVYITKKTNFNAQLAKCSKLLSERSIADAGDDENKPAFVVLHAMGSAINRAINLALRLQRAHGHVKYECFTSTILLEDDLIPLLDHLDLSAQNRHISAIHIKLTTTATTMIIRMPSTAPTPTAIAPSKTTSSPAQSATTLKTSPRPTSQPSTTQSSTTSKIFAK